VRAISAGPQQQASRGARIATPAAAAAAVTAAADEDPPPPRTMPLTMPPRKHNPYAAAFKPKAPSASDVPNANTKRDGFGTHLFSSRTSLSSQAEEAEQDRTSPEMNGNDDGASSSTSTTGFFGALPRVLLTDIVRLLDGPTVAQLGMTCKALRGEARCGRVWRRLAEAQEPSAVVRSDLVTRDFTWRHLYAWRRHALRHCAAGGYTRSHFRST